MSSMTLPSQSSPHTHLPCSVTSVMSQVLLALAPGIFLSAVFFGISVLVNIVISVVFACLAEACMLKLRKQPIMPSLTDASALVTALLFALSLSPLTVWWVSALGIIFAIVVAKQLFGGIGNNPFNPAMAGYAFILICFPAEMAYWPNILNNEIDVSIAQQVSINLQGLSVAPDAYSGATPLSQMQSGLGQMKMVSEITSGPLFGALGGAAWQWLAVAWLIGGIWLLVNKIIRWHIPVSMLAGLFVISAFFNGMDSDIYPAASYHLFTGGAMLCAFFIATDPSSSSATPMGKILYGAGIGVLVYIIRTWGSYSDGIAFAVLIMNAMVPLIDYYTCPKVAGEK